jgi:hypothetical protein
MEGVIPSPAEFSRVRDLAWELRSTHNRSARQILHSA